MDAIDESRGLAIFVALTGAAHLAKRQFFDSLVPDRLHPLRREIEVTTGSLQLAGAVALFIPRIRQTGRWLNVPVQVATLVAAVDNVRHPDRIRRNRFRPASAESLVSVLRIAPHAATVILIWRATRPRPASVMAGPRDTELRVERDVLVGRASDHRSGHPAGDA